MTNTIYDITHESDAILLVGSNPEHAHPVIGMQVRQAVQRGAKLIVVDPRDIDLCKDADIHLKLKPGTNVAFANGMMHIFIEEDLIDHKFIEDRTENFEAMKEMVKDYTPEKVAEICQIDADMLREAARIYAKADRAPIMYCLGVTEHHTGTEGVMSLSNMAMMVGKLGKPGWVLTQSVVRTMYREPAIWVLLRTSSADIRTSTNREFLKNLKKHGIRS